jgi:hypothetical protein
MFVKQHEDGIFKHATIFKIIKDKLDDNYNQIKQYLVHADDYRNEEMMTYIDLISVISSQLDTNIEYDSDKLYTFSQVLNHKIP